MMLARWALICMLTAGSVTLAGFTPATKTTSLEALRDRQRVLLIFAPSAGDAKLKTQKVEMDTHVKEAEERELVTIEVTMDEVGGDIRLADAGAARKRFGIDKDEFAVVLVGKDGGEKLRSGSPVPFERLRATIDAMPMRQDEMRKKQ